MWCKRIVRTLLSGETIRIIIGAVLLFVLIAGGSLFWYHREEGKLREQEEETHRIVRLAEERKTARVISTTVTTVQTENAQEETAENFVHSGDVSEALSEVTDTRFSEETDTSDMPAVSTLEETSNDETTTEKLVSPFGFGPYPEIPVGFPYPNPWDSEGLTHRQAEISELLSRIHIKLWNQGKRPDGLSFEDGLVYATYPNTIYVEWDYVEIEDGTVERYPRYITAGTLSEVDDALLDEGIIPTGLTVIEHSEAGIEPYTLVGGFE